ncbi:MAG: FHA domain-containing protein [Myxococcota bacterium]|nr:FHA domain-containing protein [Myxococcota bacterium]
MPKAPSTFSQDDEEEKTTIESGWEEEASTTVEQGDVAEKIRSLAAADPLVRTPNTNITSTNGGVLDEPTVDDQRANAALSLITPSLAPARIVVTGGNDKGQELEIRPGKTYTVGRAIDNDFVLTDIAVSRKHFDLRHENGTWIVVDRGSGNGTVVNGGIEDQPFVLMNGDAIEIGNTTFRFDHANQPARARHSVTFDVDEEEPSTVAGKPMRDDIASLPPQMLPPLPRPKTVPPPAPLPRPRAPSSAPPAGYGMNGMNGARGSIPPVPSAAPIGQPINQMMGGPLGVPMASPTAPTVQPMAGMLAMRPHMGPPPPHQAPTMLDANGMLRPQMLHNNAHEGMPPMQNVMPTTIPGQGPPVAPSQPQLPYGYPNVGDMKPQLQINGHIPRDATSTALVQPVPYGMQPMMPQMYGAPVAQPQPGISKKIQLLLGGALLMVLAAIATIAIIRGSSSSKKPDAKGSESAQTTKAPEKKGVVEPTKVEPTKVEPTKVEPIKVEPIKVDAKKAAEEQKKAEEAKRIADEQKKADDKRIADEAKRKLDEQKKADDKIEAQKKAEEARLKRIEAERKADEARKKKAEANKKKKTTASVAPIPDEEEENTTATNTTATVKKTVDTSSVKSKAEDLYRLKKFNDAGKTLRAAAASLGEADARDLRSIAAVYEQVGKAYNVGMGPATPPVEAYDSLVRAQNLDRPMGIFSEEIKGKLATVAPKASAKYMANKEYESAFKAVRVAEANGGSNTTTSSVREALQNAANDLYTAAMEEKSSNPAAARAKLQRIRGMVDKGSVLGKAEKALRDLPK